MQTFNNQLKVTIMKPSSLQDFFEKADYLFVGSFSNIISYTPVPAPYIEIRLRDTDIKKTYLIIVDPSKYNALDEVDKENFLIKVLADNKIFYDIEGFNRLIISEPVYASSIAA